jgi:hypothetical protein
MAQSIPTIDELLKLPERVNPSDFVIKLSEGIEDSTAIVDSYVVPPQLVGCFDQALNFVKGAVESRQSRAAYLHGSFGAGKSHFMAMLYLLLRGDTPARSKAELAEVVLKHSTWTNGRKFLLVPFHMIGADSTEERILGGYVQHLAKLHPDKPPAGLYKSDSLIENARTLRAQMGDTTFFESLNNSGAGAGGWGALGAGWDAARFERACDVSPLDAERIQLVGDLAATVLTSAQQTAGFVNLDEGLSIMSRHAQSLGYDAVILFLDELILWLASRAGSVDFVTREAPKLVKLVESGVAGRPVPIISFVARQRDLRTVLGEQAIGSEVKNFEDALNYFEARFDQIKLEDRNLPYIAQKRILVPKTPAAKELMDQAFEKVKNLKESIKEILLTQDGDLEQFRQVYPFSLALVKTLVGVSAALQRERTSLKIMVQLLVSQRHSLRLGDIVPVGDLFGAMLQGVDAFSNEMKIQFENARKLWEQKLRPLVEETSGLKYEDAQSLAPTDPKVRRLKENERIVGTLVLSALTPELETLKALTARRLAALNHGSIQTTIPGQEANQIWKRLQEWASRVGEIKINGDGVDAVVSVQLSGVDTTGIIANASHEDNHGNQLRLLKQLLSEELGVELENAVYFEHKFKWRATDRFAEVRFSNVWEADDTVLKPSGDVWQVVIDFPFDRDNHTPKDDLDRLTQFRSRNAGKGIKTLVWLPSFFSFDVRKELGRLVVLDFLLANDQRLKDHSGHLSALDRAEARMLLENQRSQLREKMKRAIRQAYGIDRTDSGFLDPAHELELNQQFQSLDGSLQLRPPTAGTVKDALQGMLSQALEHEFPGHPDFREEAKLTERVLKSAFEKIRAALASSELRILIDKDTRKELRPVLEPLELAHVGDQWLLVERNWMDHFDRFESQHQGPVTVRDLRRWIDQPKAKGLPVALQNLIIQTYVLQSNRLLVLQGLNLEPPQSQIRDETVVEKQELPTQEVWAIAVERAGKVFGVTASPLASAQNMARLSQDVKKVAANYRSASESYLKKLRVVLQQAGLSDPKSDRLTTAESVDASIGSIEAAPKPIQVVRALQTMPTATSLAAMLVGIKRAPDMLNALNALNYPLFDGLRQITDEPRASAARGLLDKLAEVLKSDDHVWELGKALRDLEKRATELVVAVPPPPQEITQSQTPVVDPPEVIPPFVPQSGVRRVEVSRGTKTVKGSAGWDSLKKEIEAGLNESAEITISWSVTREEPQ